MGTKANVTVTPGYTFGPDEIITAEALNTLGKPMVEVEQELTSVQIGLQAVDTPNLKDWALANTAEGKAKMAPSFLEDYHLADSARNLISGATLQGFRGLVATAGAYNITVTAKEAVLREKDSNAPLYGKAPVIAVADTTKSAQLTGLDVAGTMPNPGWVYLYVVSDGAGNWSTVLSANGTAPQAWFGGYTYYALVGAFYVTAGTLKSIKQVDKQAWYVGADVPAPASVGHQLTYAAATLAVPANATAAMGNVGMDKASTSGSIAMAIAADANGTAVQYFGGYGYVSGTVVFSLGTVIAPFRALLLTAQTVYLKMTDTTSTYKVQVTGWEY